MDSPSRSRGTYPSQAIHATVCGMEQAGEEEARRRAAELLGRMSLEEKVGQMCMEPGDSGPEGVGFDDLRGEQASSELEAYRERMKGAAARVEAGRIGSFVKVPDSRAAHYLQERARAARLGIPLLIGTDAIHGHALYSREATVFPTPISMASSFDTELVRRIAVATAREMRATGFQWTFAPNVDVVRDQRWGRTGETFGEDPLLVARCGEAMTEGLQADLATGGVLACAKHLVGGGEASNGINGSEIDVSERTLQAVYFPAFRRSVEAGVLSVMAAHHAVNGVPCHAHAGLLRRLLVDTWGFRGIVVSDWMDVGRLHSSLRVARSFGHACELAVNAGIDVYMAGDGFFDSVLDSVARGNIPVERIDEATLRILEVKYRLGLFEEPRPAADREAFTLRSDAHRALALEGALESIVLLQNRGALRTDHVVLAFIRDAVSSVTTPDRKLCAFLRVRGLEPGERRRVTLSVEPESMALVDASGQWTIEPGRFDLTFESLTTSFEVTQG